MAPTPKVLRNPSVDRLATVQPAGTAVFLSVLGLLLAGCGPQQTAPKPSAEAQPTTPAPAGAPAGTPTSAPHATALRFEDVTTASGIDFRHQLADGNLSNIIESDGAGGVVFDYDGDGWMDLYLVNSGPDPVVSDLKDPTARQPNRLYRNRGGGFFEDVTHTAGVAGHGYGITAAAADYDNDGDQDLLVVNYGGLILYRNRGNGTFEEVTREAGLTNDRAGISATFADVDRDGWLDLLVANYLVFDPAVRPEPGSNVPYAGPLAYEPEFNVLYRNLGDGTFEDVSASAGIRVPGHRVMSVTVLDYDSDGDADFYVCNDGTANLLLRNDGQGRFAEVALETGVALNAFGKADGSMGASVADVDGDGRPDMLVTRFGTASLYINSAVGFFEDRIEASGLLRITSRHTGWGGNLADFDNDGDVDAFISNGDPHYLKGQPCLLAENIGQGRFRDVSDQAGPFFHRPLNGRGSGTGDFDNDGGIDLVLNNLAEPAVLLRNLTPRRGHFLTLRLVGRRSNRDGFGAWVTAEAGERRWRSEARCATSYLFQSDPRLHFGLGKAERVDRLIIQWPSGIRQELADIAADQILTVEEPVGTAAMH